MTETFAALVKKPRHTIDLVHAGLLLAREEYPSLDVEAYRARFRELVRQARDHLAEGEPLARLNAFFFERLGFRGNADDYYDPRNSYLNDVLDRRLGIPITLSVLYSEIGRQLGLPLWRVGFPGRFLVGWGRDAGTFVDCFARRVLTRAGCEELLRDMYGATARLSERHLDESSPRATLERMIANLRAIATRTRDLPRALRWTHLLVALDPRRPSGYRDRGMLLLQANSYGPALADLEEYLRRSPDAPDAASMREHARLARRLLAHSN